MTFEDYGRGTFASLSFSGMYYALMELSEAGQSSGKVDIMVEPMVSYFGNCEADSLSRAFVFWSIVGAMGCSLKVKEV